MFKKKIVGLTITAIISLPMLSFAGDLTLVNDTNRDSTCVINNGACSTILGSSGVTKAHTTNTVAESKINLACILNRSNCKADVYMTDNCSGPIVGTVILDTKTGIKSVQMHDASYTITGSAFSVTLSGGPASK